MGREGWLLIKVVAAGIAFLTGPTAETRAARFEFERVCQQYNNLRDDRTNQSNLQSWRARQGSEKIKARNVLWVQTADDWVAEKRYKPHEVAKEILRDKDLNPDNIKLRAIQVALRDGNFDNRASKKK